MGVIRPKIPAQSPLKDRRVVVRDLLRYPAETAAPKPPTKAIQIHSGGWYSLKAIPTIVSNAPLKTARLATAISMRRELWVSLVMPHHDQVPVKIAMARSRNGRCSAEETVEEPGLTVILRDGLPARGSPAVWHYSVSNVFMSPIV